MKFNKEKTSGSLGRDLCLSGLAGLIFELVQINDHILTYVSAFNPSSLNFLFAKNKTSLAIYVIPLKTIYVFKKDDEDCWEEDYLEKNVVCNIIFLPPSSGNQVTKTL